MSAEPWVMFSSILLKAEKKENQPNCCDFPLSSASECSSLASPGMLGAAAARAGLAAPVIYPASLSLPSSPYPAPLGRGQCPKDFLLDTEMLARSFQAQQTPETRGKDH